MDLYIYIIYYMVDIYILYIWWIYLKLDHVGWANISQSIRSQPDTSLFLDHALHSFKG
jgi:hypothetical protein